MTIIDAAYAKKLSDYKTIWSIIDKPAPNTGDLSSINNTITNAITFIFDIAGVLAFIMILYASILYLTSYGEESRIEMAKKTLVWSVIGVIVIILAKTALLIITHAVSNPTAPVS